MVFSALVRILTCLPSLGQPGEEFGPGLAGDEIGRDEVQPLLHTAKDLRQPGNHELVALRDALTLDRVVGDKLHAGPFQRDLACIARHAVVQDIEQVLCSGAGLDLCDAGVKGGAVAGAVDDVADGKDRGAVPVLVKDLRGAGHDLADGQRVHVDIEGAADLEIFLPILRPPMIAVAPSTIIDLLCIRRFMRMKSMA